MSNHQNPIFKFLKPLIIYAYHGECVLCRAPRSGLHVHHVNFNSSDNSALNLVPLCTGHHKFVHAHKVTQLHVLGQDDTAILHDLDKFCRSYFNI
jgi:hypothetical protein